MLGSRSRFGENIVCGIWGTGYREIERLTPDDFVLSRSEFDQFGELAWKPIESTAEFVAPILHVHVRGELIRCTTEHPFFVKNWGWVAAKDLEPGDLVSSWDGQWVAVDEVFHTGIEEKVYNITVGEFHTYFVGGNEWGFSVWVHNASLILLRFQPTKLAQDEKWPDETTHWGVAVRPDGTITKGKKQRDRPMYGTALEVVKSEDWPKGDRTQVKTWLGWHPTSEVTTLDIGGSAYNRATKKEISIDSKLADDLIALMEHEVQAGVRVDKYDLAADSCFTYVADILRKAGFTFPKGMDAMLARLKEILATGQ